MDGLREAIREALVQTLGPPPERRASKNLFVESADQLVRYRLQLSVELPMVPGTATIRADHR